MGSNVIVCGSCAAQMRAANERISQIGAKNLLFRCIHVIERKIQHRFYTQLKCTFIDGKVGGMMYRWCIEFRIRIVTTEEEKHSRYFALVLRKILSHCNRIN